MPPGRLNADLVIPMPRVLKVTGMSRSLLADWRNRGLLIDGGGIGGSSLSEVAKLLMMVTLRKLLRTDGSNRRTQPTLAQIAEIADTVVPALLHGAEPAVEVQGHEINLERLRARLPRKA